MRKHLRAMSPAREKLRIAQAQYAELSKQVPLIYALLGANCIAVSYTLRLSAPAWMTFWIPAVLVGFCLVRLVLWLRRKPPANAREARRALHGVTVLGSLFAGIFVVWALKLNSYGVGDERAHVSIFIGATVIGCIFCLMHLPQAALAITGIVALPYLAYNLYSGNAIYVAITCNILLVAMVMIRVLLNGFDGFIELVQSRDETERLSRENMLLAHTDKLTGLPNRRFFFAGLERALDMARAIQGPLTVGLLDLDRFKPINDTHGHSVGDRLLEAVALRLSEVRAPGLVISRLGGDEFGFFSAFDIDAAKATGQALCEVLSRPFEIDELNFSIGASCGIVLLHDTQASAQDLFNRADYALYQAKKQSRGGVCVYSADHEREMRSEAMLDQTLVMASLDAEMELRFQPVVHFNTGRVQFVEALARWNSPVLGSVRPDHFIATAEKIGLIHDLTLVLFRKAVAALESLPPDVSLSFNLSAQDVTNPQTVLQIVSIVRRSGVDPRRLMLELTETAVMRDFQQAAESITLLRSLGMGIALDDFGTGYSSLSYLHRLPIDKVKIDRSFVHALQETSGHALLRSILTLCASMSLECVVEGVETVEQLAVLQSLGARAFQGYLFAKPMALDALLAWLDGGAQETLPLAQANA